MHPTAITLSSVLILYLCTFHVNANCSSDTLAVYELQLETFWHRKDFPKHYPEWRPPASWSKMLVPMNEELESLNTFGNFEHEDSDVFSVDTRDSKERFSHDASFEVFRKGELASQALKQFAERADPSLFDLHTQGSDGVLDIFNIPPIGVGVGSGKTLMTVDRNHTKISLLSKITPSPDWFIGVDSHDLCPNGKWLDYAHLEVGPLDAGTDKGLTFTSPNWPSEPQEIIQPITAHFPSHPAGSFFYPEIDELPLLAEFTIMKRKEYVLKDNFDAADHTVTNLVPEEKKEIYRYEVQDSNLKLESPKAEKISDSNQDRLTNQVDFVPKERRRPYPHRRYGPHKPYPYGKRIKYNKYQHRKKYPGRYRTTRRPNMFQVTEPGLTKEDRTSVMPNSIRSSEDSNKPLHATPFRNILTGSMNRNRSRLVVGRRGRKRIPSGDVMAVIDDIVKDYQKEHRRMIKKRRREERKRRREQMKKIKPPRDCRVSEWLEWSSCSKTCGIGEQTRKRKVIKHARRGGKPCPSLQETTWCGSARDCQRDYFKWQ